MAGRVLVLGATGGTGKHVVDVALERGWEVTAFVRDPARLGPNQERLRAVKGQVTDRLALAAALAGQDAVISTLGQQRGTPPDLMRSAMAALLPAMEQAGTKRLVALSGAGVSVPGDPPPALLARVASGILGLVMPALIVDTQGYADAIRASDAEWTLARPMRLTDGPGGRPVKAAAVQALGFSSAIDRRDVAGFLVDQLTSTAWLRQAPMITAG